MLKWMLTQRYVDIKLRRRRNKGHKGQALRHYANQPANVHLALGAFNQVKALVGALSMIVKSSLTFD